MDLRNDIVKYWNLRAQGYSQSNREEFADKESFYGQLLTRWASEIKAIKPKALDLGCGPGFFSLILAQMGFDVTGVDASPEMIQSARENARIPRFKNSAEDWPLINSPIRIRGQAMLLPKFAAGTRELRSFRGTYPVAC